MEAFGIFEGGGAKGIAHIGALKATEEHDIDFVGLAGTSVGAIVASLVAAGYRADEIYDPENEASLFKKDFLEFFPPADWQRLQSVWKGAQGAFYRKQNACSLLWGVISFLLCHWRNLSRVRNEGGMLRTEEFEQWLNDILARRLRTANADFEPSGENGYVTFQDLPLPLKVISADVTRQRLRVYSMPHDARVDVARAVGASISIPFIFSPKHSGGINYVDGGIVSNFPAWVFDDERKRAPPLTPTLGFRLVQKSPIEENGHRQENGVFSIYSFISDVFQTAVFGDNTLERRDVARPWSVLHRDSRH